MPDLVVLKKSFDGTVWEFAGKTQEEADANYNRCLQSWLDAKALAEKNYRLPFHSPFCPFPLGSLEHYGYVTRYNELLAEDVGGD